MSDAMPTALFSRINLDLLYPPFREKLLAVIAECRDVHGATYSATTGFRTWSEQDALFHQSRSMPPQGPWATNAPGGFSSHNYGLACDFVRNLSDSPSAHIVPDGENAA